MHTTTTTRLVDLLRLGAQISDESRGNYDLILNLAGVLQVLVMERKSDTYGRAIGGLVLRWNHQK